MAHALIGLGSNLGDRERLLADAVACLAATAGIQSVRVSQWRETTPIGGPAGQPRFLNGAALVVATLSPQDLFSQMQEIEIELGRTRLKPGEPRTADLDLLLYDEIVIDSPSLKIPHPRMAFRKFVIEPAAEIAGSMMHPLVGWTMQQLAVHLATALPYVAISGKRLESARQLAIAVANRFSWKYVDLPAEFAEITGANSPSLTPMAAIEFLRNAAQTLSREQWPVEEEGVISSFWIEDVKAIANRCAPNMFDAQLRTAIDNVVRPKLLVKLGGQTGDALAASRKLGPMIELSDENPAAAEAELTAAIQAMS